MAEFYYPQPELELNTGWFDIPEGESTLVDAARSKSYSDSFATKANEFFSGLVSDASEDAGFLRGMQILYLLGLLDLIEPYWINSEPVISKLQDPISGSVSLDSLKTQSSSHDKFSTFCERLIKDSTIDNSILSIVEEETQDLGPLRYVAKGCSYYYIILGELSTSGGVSV